MAVSVENAKRERVSGEIPNLVQDSRDLLTCYNRIWVPFIGGNRQTLMNEDFNSSGGDKNVS